MFAHSRPGSDSDQTDLVGSDPVWWMIRSPADPDLSFDLRSLLTEYEARFGVPSDRLADAFRRDGDLEETQEFLAWSALSSAYVAATTSSQRKRASRRRAP